MVNGENYIKYKKIKIVQMKYLRMDILGFGIEMGRQKFIFKNNDGGLIVQ